jgi:hypothetical protein
MTHTLGPWAFDGTRVYAPALDDDATVRGGLVALVYAPAGAGTRDANGALIALAPELLACCRQILAVIDRHPEDDCAIATVARLRAVVDQVDGVPVETP